MSMGKVVIFGTGVLAELMDVHLQVDSEWDVAGFTATAAPASQATFRERPFVAFDDVTDRFPPDAHRMFIAVGYTERNDVRERFYAEARERGYELIAYVSSRAIRLGDASIGDNCALFEGTVVEPGVTIAEDVIVWSTAYIGHHSSIGPHSFVGPGAVLPGNTRIGRNCFIGAGATLRDGITVADRCIVGAGATILSDTQAGEVYAAAATPPRGDG